MPVSVHLPAATAAHAPSADTPEQLRSSSRPSTAVGAPANDAEPLSKWALSADTTKTASSLPSPPQWPATRQRRTVRARRNGLPGSCPWLGSQRCPEELPAPHTRAAEQHSGPVTAAASVLEHGRSAATAGHGLARGPAAVPMPIAHLCCAASSAGVSGVQVPSSESSVRFGAAAKPLRPGAPSAAASCYPPPQPPAAAPWDTLNSAPLSRQPAALNVSAMSAALQQPGYRFDAGLVQPDGQPTAAYAQQTQPQGHPCSAPRGPSAVSQVEQARLGSDRPQHGRSQQLPHTGATERAAGAAAACVATRPNSLGPAPAMLQSTAAVADTRRPQEVTHHSAQECHTVERSVPAPARPRLGGASTAQPAACAADTQSPSFVPPRLTSADAATAGLRGEKQHQPAACLPAVVQPLRPVGCASEEVPVSSAAAMSGAQSGSSAQTAVHSKGLSSMPVLGSCTPSALRSQLEPPFKVCCPPHVPLGLCLCCRAAELTHSAMACRCRWEPEAHVALEQRASDRPSSSKRAHRRGCLMCWRTRSWRLLSAPPPTPVASSRPSSGRLGRVVALPGAYKPWEPRAVPCRTSCTALQHRSACCRCVPRLASQDLTYLT